ncbi:capsular polysaccharide biosynthesis protein [Cognatishimia sp. D5M38]|uniref:Capsular polysaccharide biosynthesis protein n=1 Tax=Cognatishimia coralii TaxID=3083254 RepID=A0ABU8QDK2_9RHOB
MITPHNESPHAEDQNPRRVFVYNGGFLWQRRLRRIMRLAGYPIALGRPREGDLVGVWGQSPIAPRGEAMAARYDVPLLRVEDAFLRSLHPGRAGEPPMGILIDQSGVHFDGRTPSDLETLLATHPLDDAALLTRARAAIERIQDAHLSKYNAFLPDAPAPQPGYVLVIDQTRDDAAVRASGATDADFQEMLVMAQEEHPGVPVLIKTHPETQQGFREGYFGQKDVNERVKLWDQPISPWVLFEGAVGVYTISSQMGFEAIYAGHKPRVFGQPFYAGWGLTSDQNAPARRQRVLTKAQLFAAAMMLYPTWYDPLRDQLCEIEDVIGALEAQARAWREDHQGWTGDNIRLWKRGHFQKFFGGTKRMGFGKAKPERPAMVWGASDQDATRVEDGFLRSRGLGAELVPPLSLILDRSGIYFDPSRPSDLETLISKRARLSPAQTQRAARLIEAITAHHLSKYNLDGQLPSLPEGHRILVPGQVEDDASILLGAGEIRTNLDLLTAVREANSDAVIIYKEHPDVVAGLRAGKVENAGDIADVVIKDANISALLAEVQEVHTMTSLTGFEALMRGLPVTTYGAPFYAGWGLTRDMSEVPERRTARPSLEGLVHACLIDYPRFFDAKVGLPCSVEHAVNLLKSGEIAHPGRLNRLLSKAQGVFASYQHLWR